MVKQDGKDKTARITRLEHQSQVGVEYAFHQPTSVDEASRKAIAQTLEEMSAVTVAYMASRSSISGLVQRGR
jgi:ribosomal protein S25